MSKKLQKSVNSKRLSERSTQNIKTNYTIYEKKCNNELYLL